MSNLTDATDPTASSLDESARFRVETQSVLADDLDGELVILHLATGNYYSLASTGADVWRMAAAGASLGEMADALAADAAELRTERLAAVASFLEELVAESLLEHGSDERQELPQPVAAWEAPTLNKYTDMQELLVLDPIHEVDEAGWPARRDPSSND